MEKPKVDLLRNTYDAPAMPKKPAVFFGRAALVVFVFAATTLSVLSYRVTLSGETSIGLPSFSLITSISHFLHAGDRTLKGEDRDRVNILLLGIGGEGHDGPQLTDTIMLASYKPSTKHVGILSIPRDFTVSIPGYGERKINAANALGEAERPGSGPALTAQVIKNVFGQNADYYIRVDFDGFAQFIDTLGGIDLFVDRAFSDNSYPISGREITNCGQTENVDSLTGEIISQAVYTCRFTMLSFKEGWTHMDGDLALKYVRSRHGSNGEASDFARSRRQQKVLLAVKDKFLSASTLLNPAKLNQLQETFHKNISTNLETVELLRLANILRNFDSAKIVNRVLDASPDSPLYATSLNGAYVLLPKNDDWQQLRDTAEHMFDATTIAPSVTAIAPPPPPPSVPVKLEIQNGTKITGLAMRFSQLLDSQGYKIVKVGNAEARGYDHTVIYDLTNGRAPEQLKNLQDYLNADVTLSAGGWLATGNIVPKEVSLSPQDYEAKPSHADIDFLVILGQNSANLVKK